MTRKSPISPLLPSLLATAILAASAGLASGPALA
jgi:hypothetical protein